MSTTSLKASARRVRLLLNVAAFLGNHPDIELRRLAQHFEMSERAMERLLMTELLICGIPPYTPSDYINVFIDRRDRRPRVRLHQHHEFRAPVRLTRAEAMALRIALDAYTRSAPREVRAVADSLVLKLEADGGTEPSATSRRRQLSVRRQSEDMLMRFDLIERGIAERRVLAIEYYSAERGELRDRRVHPLMLFEEGSHYYLRAWCSMRRSIRSFRVERMRNVELCEEHFTPPPNLPRRAAATPGWDGTAARGTMTVRFEPSCAEEVARSWAPRTAEPRFEKDGSLILKLPLYSEAWAIGWVLSFGCRAELLTPAHLRRELIARAKELLRLHA